MLPVPAIGSCRAERLNLDRASLCDLEEAQGWINWRVFDEAVHFTISQWCGIGDIPKSRQKQLP